MADRHGTASWPGIIAVRSARYVTSHGISPGVANLVCLPQANAPAESGTLQISDGISTITVPDCKIDKLVVDMQDGGFVWSLTIVDRRWKWRDLGGISGWYNQLDAHGKLIPWTIMSPQELAFVCLAALGEEARAVDIDLPSGLNHALGAQAFQLFPPWIGVTPVTGTNPPINWTAVPPAQALANLCELFGRRVIYRLSTDSIAIQIPGIGADLPPGNFAKVTPELNPPETPSGVTVVGAPTVYQDDLPVEPVGEDFDGSFRPINLLSYAPIVGVSAQSNTATIGGTITAGDRFTVAINGQDITYQAVGGDTPTSVATGLATIAAALLPQGTPLKVTAAAGVVTVTGPTGLGFGFGASVNAVGAATISGAQSSVASNGQASWVGADVPTFSCVQATNRLTKVEAMRLAQRTVFKCYRICGSELTPPPAPVADQGPAGQNLYAPVVLPRQLSVQGYGPIARRQQIILRSTQVEQVVPTPQDQQLRDRDGFPVTLNFYNGYSRDKPAACFGAISRFLTGPYFVPLPTGLNSGDYDQVFESFSIDPVEQIAIFNKAVYWQGPAGVEPPDLTLRTGFNIRNADSNQLEAFTLSRLLPNMSGSTNFHARVYPDVQLNVIGGRDADGNPTGATILEADPIMRAGFYLAGLAAQYFSAAGLTIEYNGLAGIDLDGAIMQITHEFDAHGARTTASRNTEHSLYVPPYRARRRAEYLAAAAQNRGNENQRSNTYEATGGEAPVSNPYEPI